MAMVIKAVEVNRPVSLPCSFIQKIRDQSSDGLPDLSDEDIVEALAENILDRYFAPEYFDLDCLGY